MNESCPGGLINRARTSRFLKERRSFSGHSAFSAYCSEKNEKRLISFIRNLQQVYKK